MYVATGSPNVKWGVPILNGGDGHHWPPHWRLPWSRVAAVNIFPLIFLKSLGNLSKRKIKIRIMLKVAEKMSEKFLLTEQNL